MHTLRIHCTGRPGAELKSVVGTCPAAAWDADDLTISVWLGDGTQTAGVPDAFDISTIETLRLEARANATTEEMYFDAKEISSFTECTFTEFKDAEGEHASFVLTGSEMNLGDSVDSIWISITAELTDGTRHTFAAGTLSISHSGDSTALGPVADPVTPYARYGFKNVAVSGQTTVTADTREDTLTLVAGSGVTLTTSGNSVTIAASGGGGGGSGTVTSVSVTSANGVSGTVANATSTPAITLTLGAITPTSVNGLTVTTTTGTLTIANGKTLTASNTLTFTGTDGSTLNIGTGGTLGTAAFTASTAYAASSHTHVSADITNASTGGNGVADSGKLVKFTSLGSISVNALTATGQISGWVAASQLTIKSQNVPASNNVTFNYGGTDGEITVEVIANDGDTLATREWVGLESTTSGETGKLVKINSSGSLILSETGRLELGNPNVQPGEIILYNASSAEGRTTINTLCTGDQSWIIPDEAGTFASREWAANTYSGSSNITNLGTITSGTWNATTIAVNKGGTGATDAATARTNLGAQATITFGTGVQTALGVNIGSAGAPVLFNGAGGTPSSITLTNATSIPAGQLTGTVSLDRLVNTQTVGNADATITAGTRDVLLTAALTAPRVYTLPAASGYPAGARLTFVDMAQTLTATNTATLQRAGSDTVNGATSLVLNTAGASPLLISDGTSKWNLDIRGVSRGGTGRTSHTAYAVLCGGTTSTGPQQSIASVGTAGQVFKSAGAGALPAFADDIGAVTAVFDGGGSAVAANTKFYVQVPYGGTIVSVTSLADVSGSAVVDVWKDTYANYPPTVADTITASAKPTISATTKATDSTLTGWTTAITAGDVLGFNVDSCSTITRLVIQLKIRKS